MSALGTELQTIIEGQGLTYLRATSINDLNQLVQKTDLAGGIGVYANVPRIRNENWYNQVYSHVDIEVYYLELSTNYDDTGAQTDVILDRLKTSADGLFDKLTRSSIKAGPFEIQEYELDATTSIKFMDERLTGWRVRMTFPMLRTVYECA